MDFGRIIISERIGNCDLVLSLKDRTFWVCIDGGSFFKVQSSKCYEDGRSPSGSLFRAALALYKIDLNCLKTSERWIETFGVSKGFL